MQSRAIRRHHLSRIKKKVKTYQGGWMIGHSLEVRHIGRLARTKKLCSCFMCGNPRKYFGEKPIRDLRNEQASSGE